jgi:Ca2+-binding RTX toxin-like protein
MTQSYTVSDVTNVHYSGNLSIDSLLDTGVNWNFLTPQPSVLYYTFDTSAGLEGGQPTITAFNATQIAATQAIFSYITRITGIQFAETADGNVADLHFATHDIVSTAFAGVTHASYGYSWNGSNIVTSYTAEAYVYLDNANYGAATVTPTVGSVGYELLLHEIGHALGLKHPFEGVYQLPFSENNTSHTLMSYTRIGVPKTVFQVDDLLALKWLYGKDGLGGASAVTDQILTGDAGDNTLTGSDGDDQLNGGLGKDMLTGGLGNDTYFVDNLNDVVNETSAALTEIDLVYSEVNYTLGGFVENLTLTGAASIGTGNSLNNVLIGNQFANTLNGLAGADTLIGGLGNDLYFVNNKGDSVTETSSLLTEIDTIKSSVGYTLGDFVENLTLTGKNPLTGTGNALNNSLIGNQAANTLVGNAGDDQLTGGAGADFLKGGLGKDSYFLTETTQVTDTVRIVAGESLVGSYDVANNFNLTADRLDLNSIKIATNAAGVNGVNSGIIGSHHIDNGLISFDDTDSFTSAITLTPANLTDVFSYLQANITPFGSTVAFNALSNTYVFQNSGANDTLVALIGVTANGLSADGVANDAVWIM